MHFFFWHRCFPLGFHQRPQFVHFCLCPPLAQVLTLGFSLVPSTFLFCYSDSLVDGFLAWFACFCYFLLDVLHQYVIMAIASLSPLFSWLMGDPPGTYPYQQKKWKTFWHNWTPWGKEYFVASTNTSPLHHGLICEQRRSKCLSSYPMRLPWRTGMHQFVEFQSAGQTSPLWIRAFLLTCMWFASRWGRGVLEGLGP